jgi:hypothetical protein
MLIFLLLIWLIGQGCSFYLLAFNFFIIGYILYKSALIFVTYLCYIFFFIGLKFYVFLTSIFKFKFILLFAGYLSNFGLFVFDLFNSLFPNVGVKEIFEFILENEFYWFSKDTFEWFSVVFYDLFN